MTDNKGTDWMYNPVSEINREEYLLGKKVGKDFDADGTMGKINDVEYDCTPGSIFASKASHQVDIQRKILEDPLVAIKKREAEDRRKLMDNPIKMKALKEHIEEMNSKKKKKKKKHKVSDDESDEDLDLKLLKKIQRMEQGGGEPDEDAENIVKKKKKKHKSHDSRRERDQSPDRDRYKRRSRSRSRDRRRDRSRDRAREERERPSPRRRRSPSDSPPRKRRPSSSPPKKVGGLDLLGKTHTKAQTVKSEVQRTNNVPSSEGRRKAMTAEEKEARLAEMMANASWRDEQRTARVTKHREEVGREEEEAGRDHDSEFMTRELQRAQGSLTVEGRITANKYKIQRGHGVMDKNFARR